MAREAGSRRARHTSTQAEAAVVARAASWSRPKGRNGIPSHGTPHRIGWVAPQVVILGGGFGGLAVARALAAAPARVLLLDRRNHHLFQPLLYQVATAGLSPAEIASPIRRILRRQANTTVLLAEATAVDPGKKRVLLVEAGPRILAAYPPDLAARAVAQLETLGAQVWAGAAVTGVDADGVQMGGDRLSARTVVWAAGVQGSPLARTLGTPLDRAGRVKVGPDLTVPGRPEIFVIGDLAAVEQDGQLVPGVA